MLFSSILLTFLVFFLNGTLLKCLGASGQFLLLGEEYVAVIAVGAILQVIGTGLVPFIRNRGGSFYAMVSMIAGFVTNIILDYFFVWIFDWGVTSAAWATVIGQGITMLFAVIYLFRKKQLIFRIPRSNVLAVSASILKTGRG